MCSSPPVFHVLLPHTEPFRKVETGRSNSWLPPLQTDNQVGVRPTCWWGGIMPSSSLRVGSGLAGSCWFHHLLNSHGEDLPLVSMGLLTSCPPPSQSHDSKQPISISLNVCVNVIGIWIGIWIRFSRWRRGRSVLMWQMFLQEPTVRFNNNRGTRSFLKQAFISDFLCLIFGPILI